jgi:serine-type D-Ala-D-Ala carboxypeptidase (penicillin-binding protein 5/6)
MNWFSKLNWTHYLSGAIFVFILITIPFVILNSNPKINPNYEFDLVQIGVIPILKEDLAKDAQLIKEEITAKHFLALDVESGAVLLEQDATASAYPASTTKMMTALVARDLYNLDYSLEVTKESLVSDNQVGFKVGERISVDDLLHASLISSSNEAAEVLAGGYGEGREEFVNLMNQKARELHLDNTLFINPSGFDNENIYSTARDLGILARELLKDEYLSEIVKMKEYTFTDIEETSTHVLYTTNQLLHQIDDVIGIKTGTTDGAGQVLVTAIERDGAKVIIVVMGSSDRYQDTKEIIDWVYSSYEWVDVDINNLID